MTGTRGIGRRRGTRGKTVLQDGYPEGATPQGESGYTPTQELPAVDNRKAVQMPTQVLTAVEDRDPETLSPSLAEEIREAVEATERGETVDLGDFTQYARQPVPDLFSGDPADRTEWFLLSGGAEPLFDATVRDLDAEYLLDASLPVPPRTAAETTEDMNTVPEAARPPAGEDSGTAAPQASPEASGTAGTEDEPVQDEPDAEPAEAAAKECAE